ncbi:MAG: 16S rRNA (cytosine(1402)-N(4))-methyltransferase RsmH [Bacilli bacterium]|nr:16S rRNA (cytosine(1402)-N(4))-methyltransferase RsmH [Bacilli bacterium]MDD4808834.1 16S rRNA (cytosine(1402)-N(4))-methyltransferase RsmH [Bacilli bacterium]
MHKSVLYEEALKYLNLDDSSIIIDCTLGYGGHSSGILKEIKRGFLFAFDQDAEAIEYSQERLSKIGSNFEIIKTNFINLKEELNNRDIRPDAILYDLGVSSPQLDVEERGFSFHNDAALDMRMNQDQSLSAYEVVNNYSYEALVEIFYKYGEEKYASSIAKGIIKERPIKTTLELVEVIKNNVPLKYRRDKHPARKVFQAIRIEVNNELNVFEQSLIQALDVIKIGGRICVITFHSLEDKICKRIFKEYSSVDHHLKDLPIIPDNLLPKFKVIGNFKPSKDEIEENNRARSATLRVIERIR